MTHEQEIFPRRAALPGTTTPSGWDAATPAALPWEVLAGVGCLLVGITLILNIHPIGDGMWFWYATDLRHGVRLYRDLHLALQPLYVLLTAAFQVLLGTGWLASKVFPLLQLVALTWVLLRLARFVPWSGWQRAVLALAAFLFILRPSTYRFDDYHVTSDVFTLGGMLLLLHLGTRQRTGREVGIFAFGMGLCCGFAAMTRLNDGAALGGAIALILLLLYTRAAFVALAGLAAGTMGAVGFVLLLLREDPRIWWHWSIAAAGAIKGGTGNILFSPLLLPWHLLLNMLSWKTPLAVVYACCLWFAVQRLQPRLEQRPRVGWQLEAALWAGGLLAGLVPFVHHAQVETPLELMVRFATLVLLVVCVAVAVWSAVRGLRGLATLPRPAYALLLFPLMHLLGGALTAAHTLPDPYLSLAMLMFVAPLLVPAERSRGWALPLLANLALLMAIIVAGKVRHPYYWWTYDDGPVYRDRVWYHDAGLGPMYIERQQLALMQGMCGKIHADGTSTDLLSMPFPYANYFCGIPPWHDYVQTWYDTSSADTIHTLVAQLETAPPRWIAYEYDPTAIEAHELTYHHGSPIAHRALKDLVVRNLASGAWTIRQHGCSHISEWLLIETRRVPNAQNTLLPGFRAQGGVCR